MNQINWRYVALYGAYVAALHALDGPWRRWKFGWEGRAVDPWTLQHLLWGAIAQRVGVGPGQLALLGLANEAVEAGVRHYRPDLLWGTPETPLNVAADLVANQAGWELARRLGA